MWSRTEILVGASSVVFLVRLCEFSRAERLTCCNHPDRTVPKMNIATFVWVECGRELMHRCNLNSGCVTCLTFLFLFKTYYMPSIFYLKSEHKLLWLFVTYLDCIPSSKFRSGSALNILQLIINLQLYPVHVFPTGTKESQFNAHRNGHRNQHINPVATEKL